MAGLFKVLLFEDERREWGMERERSRKRLGGFKQVRGIGKSVKTHDARTVFISLHSCDGDRLLHDISPPPTYCGNEPSYFSTS